MKKSIILILIIFFFFEIPNFCLGQDIQSRTNTNTLNIRQLFYNKGNHVPNPSFETAEIGKNDSLILNFKLAHWDVIGKNVQLTDVIRRGCKGNRQ
jgi:hypothetical protein